MSTSSKALSSRNETEHQNIKKEIIFLSLNQTKNNIITTTNNQDKILKISPGFKASIVIKSIGITKYNLFCILFILLFDKTKNVYRT